MWLALYYVYVGGCLDIGCYNLHGSLTEEGPAM